MKRQASFPWIALMVVTAIVSGSAKMTIAAPTFIVDAADGADLVVNEIGVGTFDSEAVPPSGAANVYASLNGGTSLLNSGNTNASLAYSVPISDGLVLSLIHENFTDVNTTVSEWEVYGFDILGSNGSTLIYDGDVNAGNLNTGADAIAEGTSAKIFDTDGTLWDIAFTSGQGAAPGDIVSNIDSVPGGSGTALDSLHTLTFTIAPIDFAYVEVNRDTGRVIFHNESSSPISLTGLDTSSVAGALDPNSWLSVSDNYDEGGTVSADEWIKISNTNTSLAEATVGIGTIAAGQSIDLGVGTWIKSPIEDLSFEYLEPNTGETVSPAVFYFGNNGELFKPGDLDFDGDVDAADWGIFRAGMKTDLSSLSAALSYQAGDLDSDGDNDLVDFGLFRIAYEAANPLLSFTALVASVPEPSTLMLLSIVGLGGVFRSFSGSHRYRVRARGSEPKNSSTTNNELNKGNEKMKVTRCLCLFFVATFVLCFCEDVSAAPTFVVDAGAGADLVISNSSGTHDSESVGPSGSANIYGSLNGGTSLLNGGNTNASLAYSFSVTDGAVLSLLTENFDAADPGGWSIHGFDILGSDGLTLLYDGDADGANNNTGDAAIADGGEFQFADTDGMLWGVTFTSGHNAAGGDFVSNIDSIPGGSGQPIDNLHTLTFSLAPPPVVLGLTVNTLSGQISLNNPTLTSIDINAYEILSSGNSLDSVGWNSLEDQDLAGFAAGDGSGNGWEEAGGAGPTDLTETFLLGNSTLAANSSLPLGSAYDAGVGTQDIVFNYRTDLGQLISGNVDYVAFWEADFDNDGSVDSTDLADWNTGYGTASGADRADGDANADGAVNGFDFLTWQRQFGNSSPLSAVTAVPEPGTAMLALLALPAMAFFGLRKRQRMLLAKVHFALVLSLFAAASPAWAGVTLDRDYKLGDGDNDNGTPAAGTAVGGTTSTGDTFDDMGSGGNNTLIDLTPVGSPVYVDVSSRPLASGSSLGILFDGSGDYLRGVRLGLPSTSISSTNGIGPLDYSGIVDRGFQFWANPTDVFLGNGDTQSLVVDTNQHGALINGDGEWVLRLAGVDFDTDVSVKTDATDGGWSHIMVVRSEGEIGGARMYVDGIAVGFLGGGYDGADDANLVVGANTDGTSSAFSGGTADFYAGVLDDLELFVSGTSDPGDALYGTFDLNTDNEFIAAEGLVPGDLTGDGFVTGDGTGPVGTDDISAFILGWKTQKLINEALVGDLETRNMGDFNYDGIVSLADWSLIRDNHPLGSLLNLGALLSSTSIPEPSSLCLLVMACLPAFGRLRLYS